MEFKDIDLEVSKQTSTSLLILFSRKTKNHCSKNYSLWLNFTTELEADKFYMTLFRILEEMKKEEHSYKEW